MKIPSPLGRRFQVDFVQARAPTAPMAWALVALGALALAAALADLAPRWSQRADLRQQIAQLQARLDRVPGVARATTRAPDSIGLAQAQGVLEQLDRPWPELFDQFESIRAPGVHLVQFGVDPRFQTVQVLAEASTLEQVLQYSRELPGRGPVRAVHLTHHEWRSAPVGRIVVASLTVDLAPATADQDAADRGAR